MSAKELGEFCGRRDIEYLNNGSVLIDGVRFAGATLWTGFQINGTPAEWRERVGRAINDLQLIRCGHRKLDTYDASAHHAAGLPFLDRMLAEAKSEGETAVRPLLENGASCA